jgi:hypothetical protein
MRQIVVHNPTSAHDDFDVYLYRARRGWHTGPGAIQVAYRTIGMFQWFVRDAWYVMRLLQRGCAKDSN